MVPAWETKVDARFVPMTERVQRILTSRAHLKVPFGMFSKCSADDHWSKMRNGLRINTKEDPEFVIHALRHTCASRLVAKGMDAFRVQKWMGHKSIATTQLYVTLFAPDLKDLAKALDDGHKEFRSVSRSVPKGAYEDAYVIPRILPRRLAVKGKPPDSTDKKSVRHRLLIRRSLVRAQVEEPRNSGVAEMQPFLFCAPGSECRSFCRFIFQIILLLMSIVAKRQQNATNESSCRTLASAYHQTL